MADGVGSLHTTPPMVRLTKQKCKGRIFESLHRAQKYNKLEHKSLYGIKW